MTVTVTVTGVWLLRPVRSDLDGLLLPVVAVDVDAFGRSRYPGASTMLTKAQPGRVRLAELVASRGLYGATRMSAARAG